MELPKGYKLLTEQTLSEEQIQEAAELLVRAFEADNIGGAVRNQFIDTIKDAIKFKNHKFKFIINPKGKIISGIAYDIGKNNIQIIMQASKIDRKIYAKTDKMAGEILLEGVMGLAEKKGLPIFITSHKEGGRRFYGRKREKLKVSRSKSKPSDFSLTKRRPR